MNPTTRILKQYINKEYITVEEIAFMCDCSKKRVYNILDATKPDNFYDWEIQKLSEWFSDQGRNELASQFKSQKYGFIPTGDMNVNGSLLDENAELVKIEGELLALYESRKRDEGLDLCDKLISMAMQTKCEFKNLD